MGGDRSVSTENAGTAGSDTPGGDEAALEPPLPGPHEPSSLMKAESPSGKSKVTTSIPSFVSSGTLDETESNEWLNIAHALSISDVAKIVGVQVK